MASNTLTLAEVAGDYTDTSVPHIGVNFVQVNETPSQVVYTLPSYGSWATYNGNPVMNRPVITLTRNFAGSRQQASTRHVHNNKIIIMVPDPVDPSLEGRMTLQYQAPKGVDQSVARMCMDILAHALPGTAATVSSTDSIRDRIHNLFADNLL